MINPPAVLTEIFLDASRTKRAAQDIRRNIQAMVPATRAKLRRGLTQIVLPIGIARNRNGDIFLVPGMPRVYREESNPPANPHERRAMVPWERVSSVDAAKELVWEMQLAMVADIERAQMSYLEDQEKRLRDLLSQLPDEVIDEMTGGEGLGADNATEAADGNAS